MLSRVDTVERLVNDIAVRAPLVAEDYRKKLKARIEEALSGAAYDETRLLTEVAVFTDKCNIDEELTRLRSHIAQFRAICEEKVVGRNWIFSCRNSIARQTRPVRRATTRFSRKPDSP